MIDLPEEVCVFYIVLVEAAAYDRLSSVADTLQARTSSTCTEYTPATGRVDGMMRGSLIWI